MEDIFDSDHPTTPPAEVKGWGADKDPKDRPGVPQETTPGRLTLVRQQTDAPTPLVGPNRFLTPVYSTALPVRGLSGMLRRAAYEIPDHKARRWMMLLAADRVDVLEHVKVGRAVVGVGVFVLALSLIKIVRSA